MHAIYTITFYQLENEINDSATNHVPGEFFKEGNAQNRINCQSTEYHQQGILHIYQDL